MSIEVVTPYDYGAAQVELAARRRFRKQILPKARVDYHGRTLNFDDAYLTQLAQSFRDGAFDQVPFQLDDGRGHINDVSRTGGELVDVQITEAGLDGIFEMTQQGAEVIENNPKLGVSARIYENFARGPKHYGRALQHVLGTVDPHITGMSGWQAVEMSRVAEVTDSLDLSEATYQEADMADTPAGTDEKVTLELSKDQHAVLAKLLENDDIVELVSDYQAAKRLNPEDFEDEAPKQTAEQAAVEEPTVELKREEPTEDPRIAEQHARIVELERQLKDNKVNTELSALTSQGLAPAIVEAARPLYGVEQPIELSGGGKVDVPGGVRKLVDTVLELAKTGQAYVDLDAESGIYERDEAGRRTQDALLDAWDQGNY